MKVWAAAMSHRGSGEVFAVGCTEAVSSWAHSRFGLADVEYLSAALSGSLGSKKLKKEKKKTSSLWLLVSDLLILLCRHLSPR